MSSTSQTARQYFAGIGLRVTIKKVSIPMMRTMRYVRQGHHVIEFIEGRIAADRLEPLMTYYFGDAYPVEFGKVGVDIEQFNPEGHGDTGTCKLCGCTHEDACHDPDTITCYWVYEDLCSACATTEQKEAAMLQWKEEEQ